MDIRTFAGGLALGALMAAAIAVTLCQLPAPQELATELTENPEPSLMSQFVSDWHIPDGVVIRTVGLPYYTAENLKNEDYQQVWYSAYFAGTTTVTGTYEYRDVGLGFSAAVLVIDENQVHNIPHLIHPEAWGSKSHNQYVIALYAKDEPAWKRFGTDRLENVTVTLTDMRVTRDAKEGFPADRYANVTTLQQ
jgi:hypothetical protein